MSKVKKVTSSFEKKGDEKNEKEIWELLTLVPLAGPDAAAMNAMNAMNGRRVTRPKKPRSRCLRFLLRWRRVALSLVFGAMLVYVCLAQVTLLVSFFDVNSQNLLMYFRRAASTDDGIENIVAVNWELKNDPPDFSRNERTKRKPLLVFLRSHKGVESFECNMNKLWGHDIDAENIAEILHDYDHLSFDSPSDFPANRTIDVLAYSSNWWSVSDILDAIKLAKPSVLLHLSDEKGNRPHYEQVFPYVHVAYRQYRYNTGTRGYTNPANQRVIPIGYHCWDEHSNSEKPSRDRRYVWSFIGTVASKRTVMTLRIKNIIARFFMGAITKQIERYEMIARLDEAIKPNFAGSTIGIDGTELSRKNAEIFRESRFVVCPRGNANVDTSRLYTASKSGAVPIVIVPPNDWEELFDHFDVAPPWLRVDDTEGAIEVMRELEMQPEKVAALQRDTLEWWKEIMKRIRENINESVNYCATFWERATELGLATEDMYCTTKLTNMWHV